MTSPRVVINDDGAIAINLKPNQPFPYSLEELLAKG